MYIGSFYPTIAPHRIEECAYVRSRHLTDKAVLAMSDKNFNVCSLNAPFILGHLPGLDIPHLGGLVQYAKGNIDGALYFHRDGTNHIGSASVSEAILGPCLSESGKPYLIGDKNYS